jgi:asparagine synthetase B (glutamine-hydrolysing)
VAVPYRMTGEEIATGWVSGAPLGVVPADRTRRSAVQALEEAIRPALLRPPCVVEFSGGRDSSVVLAIAHHLAKREGLPPPLPFTRRHPGLPEANEDEWQDMVIGYLGITEWERHSAPGEVDLLGPMATTSLRRWGVLWPPPAHTRKTELDLARGGSLLSGEGGDEVLGLHRLGALRLMMARKLPVSRANARHVAVALAPKRMRVEKLTQRLHQTLGLSWLKPEVARRVAHRLAEDSASEPLDWRKAVRRHPFVRGVHLAMDTLDVLAADAGVARINPLLHPAFINAVCRAGGTLGFTDRTSALRHLFPGLLPDAVLARTSKSRFNRAVFGDQSRAFVERWDGEGIDHDLVEADELRKLWSAEEPHAMTMPLLQACWLATDA